jgi:hypothetical protein
MKYLEGVKLKWTRQNLILENQSSLVKIYLVCIEIYKVGVCTHKYCKLAKWVSRGSEPFKSL